MGYYKELQIELDNNSMYLEEELLAEGEQADDNTV